MKKIYGLFSCVCFCLATVLYSQQQFQGAGAEKICPGAKSVTINAQSRVPSFIIFREDVQIPASGIFERLRSPLQMQLADGWQLKRSSKDHLGFSHTRFTQTYAGVPVEGGEYLVHERNGRVETVNGMWFDAINVNTNPAITEASALQLAKNYTGAQVFRWEIPAEEAQLKAMKNDANATWFPTGQLVIVCKNHDIFKKEYTLAWKFDIFAAEPMSRKYVFVSAQTGEIITTFERIHTADVIATANTMYSGTQTITTDSTGVNQYRLREAGRGQGIHTFNLANTTSYASATDFTNNSTNWTSTANDDHCANDAHWGAEKTYDYYANEHNRNGLDGNGMLMVSYVHYSTNYNNASWNGTAMSYGDGSGTAGGFNPLTAVDVCGHEFTHGVTEFSANLDYSYESGALNESFSDIFGTAIEFYAKPATADFWIGSEITVTPGTALRSMDNPNQFGDPDCYTGTNWYTGAGDNGGVHTNSGVQNFWYYLLSIGGSGTNDLNDAFNISALGISVASEIAYRNLTVYLVSTAQYMDARTYAIQSAQDIFGACSNEVTQTANAWYAVGVGGIFSPAVTAAFTADVLTSCTVPVTITFTNNSANATNAVWDFGDNSTSTTYNPTHIYNQGGTYNVSLSVNSVCGSDSTAQTGYIVLNPPPPPTSSDTNNCASTSFTLSASGSGVPAWYDQPAGGILLGTGNTYTTPVLNSTTTYYVTNTFPQPPQFIGPIDNNFGTGGNHSSGTEQYLEFTVFQSCTLLNAYVDAGVAGNKTFIVWDDQGNQLNQYIVNCPVTGGQTIALNIPFTPGNYRIGGSQMDLYRNSSGATYPYTITGVLSLTSSSAGSSRYYYLYNWEVGMPPCSSAPVPVVCSIGNNLMSYSTAGYDSICSNDPSFPLTGGTPAGGTYSGPGVTGGTFDPSQVSIGTNPITYTYTDSTNCTGSITQNVFVGECTGIQQNTGSNTLTYYPNPARDLLTINLSAQKGGMVTVTMFDLLGQAVYSTASAQNAGTTMIQISTATFARGIYFLEVQTPGGKMVKKIELQ